MKEGYCPVEWGEGSPYNQFCPLTDGKLSSTGCVPTAVAQLLSVYKFPKRYNGYDFDWEIMNRYVKTWNPSSCNPLYSKDYATIRFTTKFRCYLCQIPRK